MDFELFSDIDENFSISLMENGEQVRVIDVHPKTGSKMDRPTALEIAEGICNKKIPTTKAEFFEFMEDDDYEKFVIGKAQVDSVVKGAGLANASEDFRSFHIFLLKLEMINDFAFKEKEIDTLTKFCKLFELSVIPSYEE